MMRGGSNQPMRYERGSSRIIWTILVVLIILIVGGGALFAAKKFWHKAPATSEYQAVFLSNGQVYFGKLDFQRGWVVLKDIYYLQVTESLQPASGNNNTTPTSANPQQANNQKVQLVKLGSELHGPENTMYLSKDQILFWENMKSDSKVLQSIRQYQSQ